MATDKAFVDYVLEQMALGERATYKKMFGEYALYIDQKVVAFACDNSLFLKQTSAADRLAPHVPRRPPYPGARHYLVIDELLDSADALKMLMTCTAEALPAPKPTATKKLGKPAKPKR